MCRQGRAEGDGLLRAELVVWEQAPGHADLAQCRVDEDSPGRSTRELSEVSIQYAYFCQWGQFSCVDVAERIWIGEKEALPA